MKDELIQEILMYLSDKNVDMQDASISLSLILNNYDIGKKTTELIVRREDADKRLIEKFIISKTVSGRSERTIEVYMDTIKMFMGRIEKNLDEVTADDIRYYLAVRQRRDGISKVTANNERRNLSAFYNFLYREELIRTNPITRVERIKTERKKKKAFSDEEIEKIRDGCKNDYDRCIVEILLSTGCRVGELILMQLPEFDGDKIIVHGKGAKDRTVYLNAKAKMAIKKWVDNERRNTGSYLFPGVGGRKQTSGQPHDYTGHLNISGVEIRVRAIGRLSGVTNCHPHRFRRTCATMALRRGMSLEQVSMMLGHESLATTQIYLDLSEDELQQAHKKYIV